MIIDEFIQIGELSFPVKDVKFTYAPLLPPYEFNASSFRANMQALQSWHAVLHGVVEVAQRDALHSFIADIYTSSKLMRKPSKQTRAYYRVRARAQDRKKYKVHSRGRNGQGGEA